MTDPKDRFPKLNRKWHLAQNQHEIELSEFEYAALRFMAAFNRWNETAALAASGEALTATELSLLHVIRMQDRPKSSAMVANLLNRDDHSNIQYGLRKLRKLDLITARKDPKRKGFEYEVTARGQRLTDDHGELAREIIYPATRSIDGSSEKLVAASDLLRMLTGVFDEGARLAATFPITNDADRAG